MNTLKNVFYTALTILFVAMLFILAKEQVYLVRIEFCDGRPSKVIEVSASLPPNNSSINNYKTAVPEYEGYLNVCNVKIIKEIK